jgi:hypothetical protein
MRAALALLVFLGLASCDHNPFGAVYPDVCAPYHQTCIALGIGCADDQAVDQIVLESSTPGLLRNGKVTIPAQPMPISLPAVLAILPDATFAGGPFTIYLTVYRTDVSQARGAPITGSVAPGGTVHIRDKAGDDVCLMDLFNSPCQQSCPAVACCVEGQCIMPYEACSATTTCMPSTPGVEAACVSCGQIGQPPCTGVCNEGCASSGNNGGTTCIPLGAACQDDQLHCIVNPVGTKPRCQRCGLGRDEPCCPGADGGADHCYDIGCCDPSTNRCVVPDTSCMISNTSCQSAKSYTCAGCGMSGQACCPTGQGCSTGVCDVVTKTCP